MLQQLKYFLIKFEFYYDGRIVDTKEIYLDGEKRQHHPFLLNSKVLEPYLPKQEEKKRHYRLSCWNHGHLQQIMVPLTKERYTVDDIYRNVLAQLPTFYPYAQRERTKAEIKKIKDKQHGK
jgi:hypothetical protein